MNHERHLESSIHEGYADSRFSESIDRRFHHGSDDRHTVLLYEEDAYLIDRLAEHFRPSLESGNAAIVIATEAHLRMLESRLLEFGIDLPLATFDGRYVPLEVEAALPRFMRDGKPDTNLFLDLVGAVIDDAIANSYEPELPVSIFGELVAVLAADGNVASAVELEGLWNDLAATRSFTLLCAYPLAVFSQQHDAESLAAICDLHQRTIPAESYTQLTNDEERQRAIVSLQQRTIALESEVLQSRAAAAALHSRVATGQEQFISIAAHELKTPITSLRAYAQMLLRDADRRGTIDPERLEATLHTIDFQSTKLTQLVANIVCSTEIESGTLRINPMKTDLAALVRAVIRREFANVHRSIEFIGPENCFVQIDADRFERVIINLLENAIKFSPRGGTVSVELRQEADRFTRLSIVDDGLGVPADRRETIFERFSPAHCDTHNSGLGLGLYVAREIVALHGGEVCVEESEKNGARLTVTLQPPPFTESDSGPIAENADSLPRILVIDDDFSIRRLLSFVLEDEGYIVDSAVEGEAALERIRQQHPDLILLDMKMPGMDGWQFVRRYRELYDHQAPIMVFTAAQSAAERGAEVQAEDYIAKPFDLNDLIDRVTAILRDHVTIERV
ncbi:MAG TPA: response regulator [Nitrolancea sp.]|nr:response regulator [Nitrolancea sp.]